MRYFIPILLLLLLIPVVSHAGVMEVVSSLPGVGSLAIGAIGLVLAYIFKQIPNDILAGTVGKICKAAGVTVTLGLSKLPATAPFWNKYVEPWVIDFIDNTVGAAVNGFISGLRTDNPANNT